MAQVICASLGMFIKEDTGRVGFRAKEGRVSYAEAQYWENGDQQAPAFIRKFFGIPFVSEVKQPIFKADMPAYFRRRNILYARSQR